MQVTRLQILFNILCWVLITGGCAVAPQVLTQEEITTRVTQDLQNLTKNQEPIKGPIDIYEAIARALQYNLDTRVEVMKTMLAHQQLDVSHYNMLPRLVANAVYDGRDKFSGATSRSLLTGQTSLEPSTSSDLHVFTTDLTLSWDILDFGLSYVRAQQAADDVLMAEEVKRRVANRVIREVRTAYWRAVIAKRALPRLGYLGRWVSRALTASRKVLDRRLNSPLASLQYHRGLLATQHEIQKLYQKFATAHLDLAQLMNIVPGTPYELVTPKAKLSIPEFNIRMADLEKQALSNRPELRTIDYQKRINAKETKAAILEMLPNLNLKVGGNYNSNNFLFNTHWLSYGAQVSWNLLNVFRQSAQMKVIETQESLLKVQSLALTMAIMTQVHVTMAQVTFANSDVLNSKTYLETQKKIEGQVRHSWMATRSSEQTFIREKLNKVLAEIRYESAVTERESAYASLLATIGEDPLPTNFSGNTVAELANALRIRWDSATHTKKQEPREDHRES